MSAPDLRRNYKAEIPFLISPCLSCSCMYGNGTKRKSRISNPKAGSSSDAGAKPIMFKNAGTGQSFEPGIVVKGIFNNLFPNV